MKKAYLSHTNLVSKPTTSHLLVVFRRSSLDVDHEGKTLLLIMPESSGKARSSWGGYFHGMDCRDHLKKLPHRKLGIWCWSGRSTGRT